MSQHQEQEITLQSVGSLFNSIVKLFFRCVHKALLLIKKYFVIFIILIIAGGIWGYMKDKDKSYESFVLVKSNFGSIDYFYNKIELLNARIKQGDVTFLTQTVGLKDASVIRSVKSEPIKEVFELSKIDAVNNYSRNYDVLRLLSDNSDITKVMEDEPVKRMFENQRIIIETREPVSYEAYIAPLLAFLNSSDYFAEMQKVYTQGQQLKIQQTQVLIEQIDGILNSFGATSDTAKNSPLVMYGGDNQLNDLAITKGYQLAELNKLKADLLNFDSIIKEKNHSLNIVKADFLKGKQKFIYPIVFFVLFLGFLFFVEAYKKYTSDLRN